MASENNKRLQSALAPALKSLGFRKDEATWRKRSPEAIAVLNLQGSEWGPQFYVNLGIWFPAAGSRDAPCEAECHLRCRLDHLVPDRGRLKDLLDFEQPIPEDVRGAELVGLVVAHAVPWLERLSTIEGARTVCLSSAGGPPWIMLRARTLLGLGDAGGQAPGTTPPGLAK